MKIILSSLLIFISTFSFSQKGSFDFYMDMSNIDNELLFMNMQQAWDYLDYYECTEESGNRIPQKEIDKKISSVLDQVRSDFEETRRPYEKVLKKNEKRLSQLQKSYPYYPKRYIEYDSLLRVGNQMIKEVLPLITDYEKGLADHIKNNICNDNLQDYIWEEDSELMERFNIYFNELGLWSEGDYYFYDVDKLAKSMKKNEIISTKWKYDPDNYEVPSVLLTGSKENGKQGLFGLDGKSLEVLAPPQYDSIQYYYASNLAFAWKDQIATFYFLYNRKFYDDGIDEDNIQTEYPIPYQQIEFFQNYDYWDYAFLYYAKKDGKWGMVNGLNNTVFVEFMYDSWSEIDISTLNFEKLY